jgi:hypothetical protein
MIAGPTVGGGPGDDRMVQAGTDDCAALSPDCSALSPFPRDAATLGFPGRRRGQAT